jgi:hypothetical protein
MIRPAYVPLSLAQTPATAHYGGRPYGQRPYGYGVRPYGRPEIRLPLSELARSGPQLDEKRK